MWLGACLPSDDSPFSRDGFRPAYLASSPATSYPLSMAQILNCIRTGMDPLLMSRKARAVTDVGLTYLSARQFRRNKARNETSRGGQVGVRQCKLRWPT